MPSLVQKRLLHRDILAHWVTYYPHMYPHTTDPQQYEDEHIDTLWRRIHAAYFSLEVLQALSLDWEQFLQQHDEHYLEAIARSKDPNNATFIAKARSFCFTCEDELFFSSEWTLEDFEDEFFGPLSKGFYGIELNEDQAHYFIEKIAKEQR